MWKQARKNAGKIALRRPFFSIAAETAERGRLPVKKSHVRFFHGRPPQKKISREIFSRGASPEETQLFSCFFLCGLKKND
jgi:hypothetical protein